MHSTANLGTELCAWHQAAATLVSMGVPMDLLLQGCLSDDEASEITAVLRATNPTSVLEIGTFVGLSTAVLIAGASVHTRFVCVDADLPLTVQGDRFGYGETRSALTIAHALIKRIAGASRATMLRGFSSGPPSPRITAYWQTKGIDIGTRKSVARTICASGPYDFAFLDGDHFSEGVCSDLLVISRCLKPSGIVVLHDLTGRWEPEVRDGVARFLRLERKHDFEVKGSLGYLTKHI